MDEINSERAGDKSIADTETDDVDRYLDVLSNRYRRHALYLIDEKGVTDEETLAAQIATFDTSQPREYITPGVRGRNSRNAMTVKTYK